MSLTCVRGQHPYLDYYIYSSFTENPSNQCLIHSKQDCMNCLNSCVDAFAGGSCCDVWWCFWNPTWRIIPFSKWLITMISKSPNWGCSPSKWPKWLVNGGGYYVLTNWDDPPSMWIGALLLLLVVLFQVREQHNAIVVWSQNHGYHLLGSLMARLATL